MPVAVYNFGVGGSPEQNGSVWIRGVLRSVGHVAKRFGVSRQTVIRWYDDGELPGLNMSPHSAKSKKRLLRFSDDDIERLAERRRRREIIDVARENMSSRKK